jgi:predicted RNase H-like HicB family nuclease
MKTFVAIIEKCKTTGLFVGYIPNIQGAYSQAESLDELQKNLQEVLQMISLEKNTEQPDSEFFGTQLISIG